MINRIAFVIVVALVLLLFVGLAISGELYQRQLTGRQPLIQNNYVCDAEAGGVDLRCGLIVYYRFEQASLSNGVAGGVTDLSGEGNHGMAVNAVSISGGKLGRGAQFVN
jgi:hypothetical protein